MVPLLAHGALGYWDELIFLGVAVIFIGMMFVSWTRSRFTEFTDEDLAETPAGSPQPEIGLQADKQKRADEHFELD